MKKLVQKMLEAKPVLPGTLEEHYNVCGKAGCRCKDKDNPQKHGPYFRLSYRLKGKNSSVFVSKEDSAMVMKMTDNYRDARSNIQDIALEMVDSLREVGLKATLDKYNRLVAKSKSKLSDSRPESELLRKTKISRDSWKTKAMNRHAELEKNKVTIRDLKTSRNQWKDKAMKAQLKVREINKKLKQSEKQIKKLVLDAEKKTSEHEEDILIENSPCGFKYPLKTIVMSIKLVVFGLCSLRGAERVMTYFAEWFKGGIPCYVVIQNWIMRYGLYLLKKPVEKRDDWIYVLDHTIEFGVKKCLVVLGITLETFRKNNCKIQHKDMSVLAIDITESATSDTVFDTLQRVKEITGVPMQVISDNGSNIKRGIEDFMKVNAGVRKVYDVTHKAALILKAHLEKDESWQSFIECTGTTKRKLVHTKLFYIAPPKAKDKSRWLNLDLYIEWAENVLLLDMRKFNKKEKEKYRDNLLWINDFKIKTKEWRTILDLIQAMKNEVKENGFRNKTLEAFEHRIDKIKLNTPRLIQIKSDITKYLKSESEGLGEEPWLGCSDIIESVFGKYKLFSNKTPMKEIGKSVLTMPILTSEVDSREVLTAMESISAKDLEAWLSENIGKTFMPKRIKAFSDPKAKKSVKKSKDKSKKAVDF